MKRIGILGNGQLGAMLAQAAHPLGITCEFFSDQPTKTCENLGQQRILGKNRAQDLSAVAKDVDIITYESENISAEDLGVLPKDRVLPKINAITTAQDRLKEKSLCRSLRLRTAEFAAIDSYEELVQRIQEFKFPSILKTRTLGYDGKGQWKINSSADLLHLKNAVTWTKDFFILESFVHFDREISIVAVRAQSGEIAFYPISENLHVDGILRSSRPSLNDRAQVEAEAMIRKLAENLDYVGVITLELFDCKNQLLVNEIAPRVHNSGHFTIEASATSQFENHIRAICGLPLGSTKLRSNATMYNIIGEDIDANNILKISGAHFHDYFKLARKNRKLGHITVVESDSTDYPAALRQVEKLLLMD